MKKAVKILIAVAVVIVILLFGAEWWVGNKVKKAIVENVSAKTGGAARVTVGRVKVRLLARAVLLQNVQVVADSLRPENSDIFFYHAEANIREIALKGIHYDREDSIVTIRLRELEADIPDISAIVGGTVAGGDDIRKKGGGKNGMTGMLPVQLQVEKAILRLDSVRCRQYRGNDTVSYALEDFSCRLQEVKTVNSPDDGYMPFSFRDVQLSFSSFRHVSDGKAQLLHVDSLNMQGAAGIISIGSISLIPQYGKDEFVLRSLSHSDWTQARAERIECRGFDLQRLIRERFLQMDSIGIQHATASSFKNRQVEQPRRVKLLFYESVQQFPVPFSVRKVKMDNIHAEYQELSKNGTSPGTVVFDSLRGILSGLTNVASDSPTYYTLSTSGKLMDQGDVSAVFRLPVDSLNPHFKVEGRLGRMSMLPLNKMVEPLVKMKIVSGEIQEIKFTITGNSHRAHVDMLFLYEDLKVRLLKEKDGQMKSVTFLNNLVNGLLLKEDNPDRRGTRRAEATAERDIYRSQFNYLWRTVLAGLKISVGIDL